MSEITRKDLFIHAYLNAGYEPEDAIIMADAVLALMAQGKSKETPVKKPQEYWKPTIRDDVDYFHRQEKFANNYGFVPDGVSMSLVNDHLRMSARGTWSHVKFECYGEIDSAHTIDTFVFDLVTPNRGVWFDYAEGFTFGLNFEDGCIERIDYDHNVLAQSVMRMICGKGDRILFQIERDHGEVKVYACNLNTNESCFLSVNDNTITNHVQYLDMIFSDDVITEIELVYLSFGLKKTSCCAPYEFHCIKDFDWEEKEWFDSEAYKDEYRTLARSGQFIAYAKRNLS